MNSTASPKNYTQEEIALIRSATNEDEAIDFMAKDFPDRSKTGIRQKFYSEKQKLEVMEIVSHASSEQEALMLVALKFPKYSSKSVSKAFKTLDIKRKARKSNGVTISPSHLDSIPPEGTKTTLVIDGFEITISIKKVG